MTPEQREKLGGMAALFAVGSLLAYVDSLLAQARAEERERSVKIMRETTAKTLNLHYEQRAYSWHEIQDTMSECDKAIRARKDA